MVVDTISTQANELERDAEHRRRFIERMERKLARKAAQRRQRQLFRIRLARMPRW